QDLPAARCREGKFEFHPLGIALDLDHLDLLKLLDARLNLTGLVCLVTESIYECLDPRDLFRLASCGSLALSVPLCANLFERGIVAAIFFDLVVSEIPGAGEYQVSH